MISLVALLACATPEPSAAPAPDVHAHPEVPEAQGLVLALDGAARWKMDEHTRSVMAETRAALAGAEPATVADAVALGGTLQGQLDRLIQGCTMEGPAHDELHVFLMAWIPELTALQGATELADGHARVASLKAMLATYDETFE